MGRKKQIGTVTQKKGKSDEILKEAEMKSADVASLIPKTGDLTEKKDKSKTKDIKDPQVKESGKDKIVVDGEFDLSDLEEGLEVEDFEDPEYFTEDEGIDGEEDCIGFGPEVMFDLFSNFFEYENQNVVETLCQVRDSIDANSKCLLRVAHEIRNLHNAYMHINMEKGDDKVLAAIPKTNTE